MAVEYGRVVKSLCGKDAGRLLAVVGNDCERVLVCDGDLHTLERPKQKNLKHLSKTDFVLDEETMTTNRNLRRALRRLDEEDK